MSISNRHTLVKLEKNSKPMTGQRLARVIAKAAKEALGDNWIEKANGFYNPNLTESLCVSVPHVEQSAIVENIDALVPHIMGLIQDTQDAIIAEKRKETGCNEIADDDISVSACVAYLDAVAKGNRVTGEYLVKWFSDTYSLQAAQFIALACKFSMNESEWTPDQCKVIEQKSNVLASMFAGFASGKYSPDIPKCKAMIRFGQFLTEEGMDSRMNGFVTKATKILDEKTKELSADALGF